MLTAQVIFVDFVRIVFVFILYETDLDETSVTKKNSSKCLTNVVKLTGFVFCHKARFLIGNTNCLWSFCCPHSASRCM